MFSMETTPGNSLESRDSNSMEKVDNNGLLPTHNNGLEIIEQGEQTHNERIGQAANGYAALGRFAKFRSIKKPATLISHDSALAVFADYLASTGFITPGYELHRDGEAWKGITGGLVEAFIDWQLNQGYAIGTINIRLSTIKVYAKQAYKAGAITQAAFNEIRLVDGYSHNEGLNVDTKRSDAGGPTRYGSKKAESTVITTLQAEGMKVQPVGQDTPQGRRDALMMCLFLDWGLRVSEVAILEREAFDLEAGKLTFYRPKVYKIQTIKIYESPDTLAAAKAYLEQDAPSEGAIWLSSNQDGTLNGVMSAKSITRAIRAHVARMGKRLGLDAFSPHDCRHYLANKLGPIRTTRELMDIFGWTSPSMALRYQAAAKVVRV